jgi:hypothetical protein
MNLQEIGLGLALAMLLAGARAGAEARRDVAARSDRTAPRLKGQRPKPKRVRRSDGRAQSAKPTAHDPQLEWPQLG